MMVKQCSNLLAEPVLFTHFSGFAKLHPRHILVLDYLNKNIGNAGGGYVNEAATVAA